MPRPPAPWMHGPAKPEGALALLVLLDQFPRNAWRGSGHMFATDGKALAVARAAVDAGLDLQTEAESRPFFYLPFMHSEALADQERSVALNRELDENTAAFCRAAPRHHCAASAAFPTETRRSAAKPRREERTFLDEGGFSG